MFIIICIKLKLSKQGAQLYKLYLFEVRGRSQMTSCKNRQFLPPPPFPLSWSVVIALTPPPLQNKK